MARSTLNDLIADLRDMTQAGEAEWTLGDSSYFDDDQMQKLLDARRRDVYRHALKPVIDYQAAGSVQYFQYETCPQLHNLEATDGGTALYFIEDATGANVGTAEWSADYRRGLVTFTADRGGTAYYLTARTYDLAGAAADLLDQWIMHERNAFDVSTPEVTAKRSQKLANLERAASRYRQQAWVVSYDAVRGDVN